MKTTARFWFFFVLISGLFLGTWYFYWETRNGHLESVSTVSRILPLSNETRGDLRTVADLAQILFGKKNEEQTYLILFQNNLELRPGGGFIGSFGILKTNNGTITEFTTHDTGNFDARIPDTTPAPYPFQETLRVKSLKLRDSNISPDWPTNAKVAENFYREGQGQEDFDGVIGITTNVLSSFLAVTGPVEIPGYPGVYGSENAVIDLEFQVEKGFDEQGIERGERKGVMTLLGNAILDRVKDLSLKDKLKLAQVLLDDLHKKDIQLYFKDENLEQIVTSAGWGGEIDSRWSDDYLMLVDSNMGAFKTDYRIKRSIDYSINLQTGKPTVTVKVTYEHMGEARDYMTKDYQSFTRLYVPAGSWLEKVEGHADKPIIFGEELGKKYFGTIVWVPLGQTRTVTWTYQVPATIAESFYDLKIEKQAGVNDMPVKVTVIKKDGAKETKETILNRPLVWSEGE